MARPTPARPLVGYEQGGRLPPPVACAAPARLLARHALHVLAAFAVTLAGLLIDARQPITTQLVIATLPAAAVATLRTLETRRASSSDSARQAQRAGPGG